MTFTVILEPDQNVNEEGWHRIHDAIQEVFDEMPGVIRDALNLPASLREYVNVTVKES